MVGVTFENALGEMENVGTKKEPKMKPKYTLAQLLDEDFRLDAPLSEQEKTKRSLQALKNMKGVGYKRVSKEAIAAKEKKQ